MEKNSCLRMAYIMAFAISGYSDVSRRVAQPFNPMLGETFEFEINQNSLKFLAE